MSILKPTDKIGVVILAAGEGKRMKSQTPKVMHLLKGQPLIDYIVKAVEHAGLPKPVVVVSAKHGLVQDYLGNKAIYAIQNKQLGTGHALLSAKNAPGLKDAKAIVVLSGDMPSISAFSLQLICKLRADSKEGITFAAVKVPNFENNFVGFNDFGRVVNSSGKYRIVEFKDAVKKEKNIKELNAGIYCFSAPWVWKGLALLNNKNAQKEFYLTDLIKIANEQKLIVNKINIKPEEAMGVNTKEQLAQLNY